MSLQRTIGRAIRLYRVQLLRMSQEGFADRIGMHRAYYGALERGEKNLQLSTLQRVSDGLAIRISDLFARAEGLADE